MPPGMTSSHAKYWVLPESRQRLSAERESKPWLPATSALEPRFNLLVLLSGFVACTPIWESAPPSTPAVGIGSNEEILRTPEASSSLCPDGRACGPAATCGSNRRGKLNGGEATVYWFAQGTTQQFGDVACGFGIKQGDPLTGDGDIVLGIADPELFGAMNTEDYRDAAACGTCVKLYYQDRSVQITIVDECPLESNPTCTRGHIDLSRAAWNRLTDSAPATELTDVRWEYAPCPTVGGVSIELKEPGNGYFNEFLVRNHRYELSRSYVQMADGTWVDAKRRRYNYWRPTAGGSVGGDMGTYRVRVEDIHGSVVEQQLELTSGQQGGTEQFPCQFN